jgi:hypothetical protein
MRPLPLLALLAAPALAGCLGGGGPPFFVVAQAPSLANGMTVAVAAPGGPDEGLARFTIAHDGLIVYPVGGGLLGVPLPLEGRQGSAFVPYSDFVVDVGDYVVDVAYQGQHVQATATVQKWVRFVYAFPYLRNDTLVTDLVLEDASGQPNERMFAAGQWHYELHFRGDNSTPADEVRWQRDFVTDGLDDHLRVEFPLSEINQTQRNKGYYSAEATFNNFQALGNDNVPMDPALRASDPPLNWVYLDLPDQCDALLPGAPAPPQPVPPVLPCNGG